MTERHEDRIDAALAEYLAACDAGKPPDRAEFLARYPELASFLNDHEALRRAVDPAATLAPPVTSPQTLHYVGDYELIEEIARGGMGVVYRARQVSVNRPVAVKMILAGAFADEAGIQRFRIEAEAAANLDHPNILPIYEVSEHEGRPYFSMKLAEGGSLAGRSLTARQSAALVAKLARAVHFAHQRGILHRDLKPANVLLDVNGEPLIADFGLAKRVESDAAMTQTGAIVGTPSYMPPEQARGEKGISTAADVYSLGAILYECLTGRPPFREASVMETLLAVVNQEPPAIANADADLAVIALKCLRKAPRERYASASDLADDLERWLRGEPILARPASTFERAVKWVRRNPVVTALAITVVLVLVTGSVISTIFGLWAMRASELAGQRTDLAIRNANAAISHKDRGDRLLRLAEVRRYGTQLGQAFRALQDGNGGLALETLSQCSPAQIGPEYRLLWTLLNSNQTTLRRASGSIMAFAVRPDGLRFVSGGIARMLIRDSGTGEELLALEGHTGIVTGVCFSRDGKRLASSSTDRTAIVWDAETGKILRKLEGHTEEVWSVAISPDGLTVAAGANDGTVRVWEVEMGRELHRLSCHKGSVHAIAYHPRGRGFATAGDDVKFWNADKGEVVRTLAEGRRPLAYSPDGERLVSGGSDRSLTVWNTTTGESVIRLRGHRDSVNSAAYHPDGSQIVTAGHDTAVLLWDAVTGELRETFLGHRVLVSGVGFSLGGNRVVSTSGGGVLKFWDPRGPRPCRLLPAPRGGVTAVATRPGGEQFATTNNVGDLTFWDARTAEILSTVKDESDLPILRLQPQLCYSPDGRFVARSGEDLLRVYDTESRAWLPEMQGARTPVAYSPNGRLLVSGMPSGHLKLWDAQTGVERLTLAVSGMGATTIAFSPDGTRVASAGQNTPPQVWDVASGRLIHTLETKTDSLTRLTYHPDGTWIFGLAREEVHMWEAATGKVQPPLRLRGAASDAVLSHDGKRLLLLIGDRLDRWGNALQFIDAETRVELLTVPVANHRLQSLAVSSDGKRILAQTEDDQLWIWNADLSGPTAEPRERANREGGR